ncbi:hypothetical protein FH608_026735 [Nonomuraea phyllanthi]|uniref:Uncharacterized protein n=1 Tax=Nonomuraea phyllanthi TaxID=2219224 RepID=A0A5C4W783_9ACTN|nr:hypothetical protein [Nonomuraea phyllanthi]KAB8192281.1 hypothetical protein FH608_026735 [Nonomuraea phyllanthi]QFY11364.1 hypothetical protein GBF35_36560 [Nonomuraea phyllanthi]
MTRNGPDDATRRGTSDVEAIEGLLAYAQTRSSRWGGAALKRLSEAVARSRALDARAPGQHTALLARSLLAKARLLLERNRAGEALPLAEEAVALAREVGGPLLVMALSRLAATLEALHRYSEAAATIAEADQLLRPDEPD